MDNPSLSTEETPSTETAKPKRPTRGKTRSLDDRISMREAELVELRKQKALRTVSKDPSRKKIVTSIKHLRFAAERLSDKKLKAICFQAAEDLESAINGQLVLE